MNRKEIASYARRHGLTAAAEADLVERLHGTVLPDPPSDRTTLADWGEDPPANSTLADILPGSGEGAETLPPPATSAAPQAGPAIPERYESLGLFGIGGMGEVHKVRDTKLGRILAMKILHPELMGNRSVRARFVEEAAISAQLQHPGIVPVHDTGVLPDGRHFLTMRPILGRTLSAVIQEVHGQQAVPLGATPWTYRGLVQAFHQVCEALAFAHSRGVIHRDLKPDNIMLGAHGEVLVVDWGLAKVVGAESSSLPEVRTTRGAMATRMGAVAGTPAYMAPEQARGEIDRLDQRSDVYALGAILYELLSAHPAYIGSSALDVLQAVLEGPPPGPQLPADSGCPLPEELVMVAKRAMAREPADRFETAHQMVTELAAWLEGARRQERADELVAQALDLLPQAESARVRARALRGQAKVALDAIATWKPETERYAAWALEEEAGELERQAKEAGLQHELLLQGALTHVAEHQGAHAALCELYRQRHQEAEAARLDPTQAQLQLREHLRILPPQSSARRPHEEYLHGDGSLTLTTSPAGARVEAFRYVERQRRLVPESVGMIGTTPLVEVSLPMGSHLLVLHHPDCEPVRYPVFMPRSGEWHARPPGESVSEPVVLPPRGSLGPDDCYVPGGWFLAGASPSRGVGLRPIAMWVDGFVSRRFPVTNREYMDFLDDLLRQGREEDALRYTPRERGEDSPSIFGRDGPRHILVPDQDGDIWEPDWPVMMVGWHSAMAYARWRAEQDELPWRLLDEYEREKAARGVDGRNFPWGDAWDSSRACMGSAQATDHWLPHSVHAFPLDESVYGVRGVAAGIRDWCLNLHGPQPPAGTRRALDATPHDTTSLRAIRGGNWAGSQAGTYVANKAKDPPGVRIPNVGLRIGRSLKH